MLQLRCLLFLILSLLYSLSLYSQTRYKTHFGNCPTKTAGDLTLSVIKIFEESNSLRKVKQMILEHQLGQEYFISDYIVEFSPALNQLSVKVDCPHPLAKVQLLKESGLESYSGVLVSNGDLYPTNYLTLLKSESLLKDVPPVLTFSINDLNKSIQKELTEILKKLGSRTKFYLAEMVVSSEEEMTLILSINQNPTTVYLGNLSWDAKLEKLEKLIGYFESQKSFPTLVNLTNEKKVVVKFSRKF